MGYEKQFQVFEPLSGHVPDYPFFSLPEVAQRARALLISRSKEQIDSVANEIDWMIGEYFRISAEEKEREKQKEIERLRAVLNSTRRWKRDGIDVERAYDHALTFFDRNEWGFEEHEFEWVYNGRDLGLDIDTPTPENTSELQALKYSIDWWDDIGGDDFPNGRPYEFFAVLSLWLVADAMECLRYRRVKAREALPPDLKEQLDNLDAMEKRGDELVKELGIADDITFLFGSESATPSDGELNLLSAGNCALSAMDAVCYAERLREVAGLQAAHCEKEAKRQDEVVKRRSIKAQNLNIQRHRNRNEARNKVIEEWEKNPSRWRSAEKAGLYLADWLEKQEFVYEPRTVTGWIRDHAKKVSVKFR